MYLKKPPLLVSFGITLLVCLLCLPQQGTAQTWGYPPDSSLGQCLANQTFDYVLFPDRDTALATVQAEVAAAQAHCAGLPNPKPSWCNCIYYWEFGAYQSLPACLTACVCSGVGCSGKVTDGGFGCYNCRDYGVWENGNWKITWYWYYVCSPTYPPPSQVQDLPVATDITDINAGRECGGMCNTTVNDTSKNSNTGFEIP